MTQGRVTAILYSRLATSPRSLAIILLYIYTYYHSHPRLQPYSYNYHPYAYEAERWLTCPYTIIAFSVNGYVSLVVVREFTPFPTRDTIESTIENTVLQTRYQSIIAGKHEALIVPSFNWATWQQRSRVQRRIGTRGISPAITAITTSITSTRHNYPTLPTREIEYDRSNWVWTPFLRVNWAPSSPRDAATDGVIIPLNAAMLRTKGEVERRFTSQHSYNYIPSTRVKCTYFNWRVHLQF